MTLQKIQTHDVYLDRSRKAQRAKRCKIIAVVGHVVRYSAAAVYSTQCCTFAATSATSINGNRLEIPAGAMKIFYHIFVNQKINGIHIWHGTSDSMAPVSVALHLSQSVSPWKNPVIIFTAICIFYRWIPNGPRLTVQYTRRYWIFTSCTRIWLRFGRCEWRTANRICFLSI